MPIWFLLLTQAAILSYAFIGGVFLAFSDFIMRSLSVTSGTGGVEAMQAINREVFRWVFMALFLGMAVISAGLAGYAALSLSGPTAILILSAALLYLLGCFGVTVLCNVPMNEALAQMEISEPRTQRYWTATYLPRWTLWNTVRTIACALSATLLLLALSSVLQRP